PGAPPRRPATPPQMLRRRMHDDRVRAVTRRMAADGGRITPMLSLQEISDRLEIEDLMVRYSHAIDTRQWDLLDELFTDDAHIDYTAMGGPAGDLAATKQILSTTLPLVPAFHHPPALPRLPAPDLELLDHRGRRHRDRAHHVPEPDADRGAGRHSAAHAVRAVVPGHLRPDRRPLAYPHQDRGEELHVPRRPGGHLAASRPQRRPSAPRSQPRSRTARTALRAATSTGSQTGENGGA